MCSMWPPFRRVTCRHRRHMFVNTRWHKSSSVPLHNSNSIPLNSNSLDGFRGKSFSFRTGHKEKSHRFRVGLWSGQKLPQLWRAGQRSDTTRRPKTVLKKSSATFTVCGVTASSINRCFCRGKPLAVSCGKKSFQSIRKYRLELTISFKNNGPIKLWLDMATQTATLSIWLLFSRKFPVSSVPQTRMFCLFVRYVQTGSTAHLASRPVGTGDQAAKPCSCLVLRIRMRGALSPLSHTSTWQEQLHILPLPTFTASYSMLFDAIMTTSEI